jgi:hypothetical protein
VLNLLVLITYPTVGGIIPLSQLFKEAPTIWWFGIPALLFLIAGMKLQWSLDRTKTKPRPNLELLPDSPHTEKCSIRTVDSSRQLIGEPFLCQVKFQNKPNKRSPEANAIKVRTEMTFFGLDGNQKLKLDRVRPGGVAEPPHQQPSESPHKYYEVEYSANGESYEITIALKYLIDANCYAYDDRSYNTMDWRKPEYLLQGDKFYVKIDLIGENTKAIWWFELENNGVGKDIKITAISPPMFHKEDSQN